MSEISLKIEPRTVFAFIFIIVGVIVILIAVVQAFLGIEDLSEFTNAEAYIQVLAWLFVMVVKLIGGFFLASIGLKIFKK